VLGGVVLALVHAHQQRLHPALARGGDDDLLGPGREVALGLLEVGEEAGALEHVVGPELLPGELARVLGGHDALHLVAAHDQDVVALGGRAALLRRERVLEAAVHGVVLHLVGEVVGVGDDVDDTDDVDLLAEEALIAEGLEDQAADPAEPIDTYFDRHLSSTSPCEPNRQSSPRRARGTRNGGSMAGGPSELGEPEPFRRVVTSSAEAHG
jgi:hypothetical protein